ncbi:MAG: RNA methyltransferase [Candidatus Eremiobacteraeota bacterium]|nr:RNA methyltransferase [Candidatus Eremiobacteraeota bacterium]
MAESVGRHNAAVRAARLLQQKKHRLERRCFLIEGPTLVEAALESGAAIEQVFILDEKSRAADFPPRSVVALERSTKFAPLHGAVLRVDRRTLDSLSQTKAPQGIVAVAGFVHREVSELERLLPGEGAAAVLVLPNLSDPGNAGTLIRSAEAFGARVVCFGPEAVDPYNDKVVRASMGSLFRVPLVRYESWTQFVAAARAADLRIVAADASGEDVRVVTLPQRAGLVVGQERHGLAGIPRDGLDMVVALPQCAGSDSLNAGIAGSIVLYEFARANGLLGPRVAGTTHA